MDVLLLFFFLFRYAVTDMRKLANRMLFGVPEESSLGKLLFLQLIKNLMYF